MRKIFFLILLLWCSGFGSLRSSTSSPTTTLVAAAASTNDATEGENSNLVGKSSVTSENNDNEHTGMYQQSRRGGKLTLVTNCLAFVCDKVEKLKVWCSEKLIALVRRTQNRNDSNREEDRELVQQQHCDATEKATAEGACPVVTAEEEEKAYYDTTKTIETDAGFMELWDLDPNTRRKVSVDAVTAWMGCTLESTTKEGIYIPTHDDFQLLVEAYNYAIAQQPTQNNQTTNAGVYFDASVETYNPNAFQVEVEVHNIPRKGRGIVTMEDIKKGTKIWTPRNTAEFPNTDVVRDFFLYLFKPYHRNRKRKLLSSIACDLFSWGYTMQTTQNPYGEYLLCLDLDHASLMNQPEDYWYEEKEDEEEDDYYDETEVATAGDTGDDGSNHGTNKVTTVRKMQVANAGQLTQERNDTGILYALRDIQAGEGTSMFWTLIMCCCSEPFDRLCSY